MTDSELKREVIDTRNQIIKTDNHVANLSLDIKGFEKRFDALEKQAKVATIGVHAIVALVIGLAAFGVTRAQSAALSGTIEELETALDQSRKDAQARTQEIENRLAESERKQQEHQKASDLATEALTMLEAGRESDAISRIESLDMKALTTLERSLVAKRIDEPKQRAAESAYKSGKRSLEAGRAEIAISELRRSLNLNPVGRYADQGRYLLLTALWREGRHDEVDPLVTALLASQTDRALIEELRFIHASSLAHRGKVQESKAIFQGLTRSRFATSTKAYLSSFEGQGELPAVPAN